MSLLLTAGTAPARGAAPRRNGVSAGIDPRTRMLLEAPIVPVLFRLAWPNILVMIAQSGAGLIELWFVARLGTDALTGIALVMPARILMQNMAIGAVGSGISSAIARALGAGRRDADGYVLHAILINVALGLAFMTAGLAVAVPLYRALGGSGAALGAAVTYSDIIFLGMVPLWVLSALASIIRGTGNMLVPGLVMTLGMVLLVVPLTPCLIFGLGPFPAMGIAGGGAALLVYYVVGSVILGLYIASGRNLVRFRLVALRRKFASDILSVGAVSAVNTVLTNVMIALVMALVAAYAGARGVAGVGTGTRLEFLLAPLVFGFGGPLVALVGANVGAGQQTRALRIAMTGGGVAFALTETIGLAAAIWPHAWLLLFGHDPAMLAAGTTYLRIAGPFFGFYGLGIALYFASQGAGRLGWPLAAGFLRVLIAVGGGWIVLRMTGSLEWLFAVYALGLLAYGTVIAAAVASGQWFRRPRRFPRRFTAETQRTQSISLRSLRLCGLSSCGQNRPAQAVLQEHGVEVDQQPQFVTAQTQICQHLCLMQRGQSFD